ncbi:MAG: uroporphyrinogen decarboxylase family protein [Bacteroidales bacterium]|nr:uroporphyrinogen decarboxylase family protein [Bacteroidales bacterium]
MTMKEWSESLMESNRLFAIPIMTHPGIDLIGKNVIDAVKSGKVHAEAVSALSKEYPSDGATVIMDLTVEAEAFGASISFAKNEVPNVINRLLSDQKSVEELTIPDLNAARIPEYIEANRIAAKTITDKPIFGGCIGPFSLAGRLFDITEFMMSIYTEPETAMLLLEKCSAFISKYVKAIKETGVNGIIMAEPAAGLLSDEDATAFSSTYIKQIVDEVQDDDFLFVLHNCGNTGHCTPSMIATGANVLHFGNKINITDALQEVPSDILVMGNLDPVTVFKQETPTGVANATKAIIEATKEFKNFVLSSGCDTPPGVPLENIEAFYNTLSQYNKGRN